MLTTKKTSSYNCAILSERLIKSGLMCRMAALFEVLIASCIMLKNGQTYYESLAVCTPQDFLSMLDHFSAFCTKGLNKLVSFIRHYIESIAVLRDSVTVELFYLQAKALIFKVSV